VSNYERYEIDGDSDSDKEHNSATKRRLPEINGTQNKHQRLNSAFESLLEIRRNQTDRVDGEDDRRTDGDDEEVNRRTDEKTKEMIETTDKQTMQMMGIPSTTVVVVSMKTTITRKTMMQKIIVQIQ
jgi:hypothetical protein